MARDALHLCLRPTSLPPVSDAIPPGAVCRPLSEWDATDLGELMWAAYRGTIDDEYADEQDAIADAESTLAGRWGPLIWDASLTAAFEGRLVAAVIVVNDIVHDSAPLLAFALTVPAWQRRGLAGWLIRLSVSRLADLGESELHLAVTRGNPALALYERIGFRVVE
ncbi:MAG TPA: GNAT family N-acetyltransferase [Mycobacteriales bacterium]|nr:GNAT family N-acetyltransferase [Mycobacteriales bacterium]